MLDAVKGVGDGLGALIGCARKPDRFGDLEAAARNCSGMRSRPG